jgi:Leucine-rich repeat (LRR) protein
LFDTESDRFTPQQLFFAMDFMKEVAHGANRPFGPMSLIPTWEFRGSKLVHPGAFLFEHSRRKMVDDFLSSDVGLPELHFRSVGGGRLTPLSLPDKICWEKLVYLTSFRVDDPTFGQLPDFSGISSFLRSIDLTNSSNFRDFPKVHLSQLRELKLTGTVVEELPPSEYLPNLRSLDLRGVATLTSIPYYQFLEDLDLMHSGVNLSEDAGRLGYLKKVQFSKWKEGLSFRLCRSLKYVWLDPTKRVVKSEFGRLLGTLPPSIKELTINNLLIRMIPELAMFIGSGNLRKLHLLNCGLENLPMGKLDRLTDLDLRGSSIETFEYEKILISARQLVVLNLAGCDIRHIKKEEYHPALPQGQVKKVDLSVNSLKDIPEEFFWSFGCNVVILNLGSNRLEAIPASLPRTLRILDVSDNEIEDISAFSAQELPKLEDLNLSNNFLRVVDAAFGSTFESLEILNLGNNQLTTLPRELFDMPLEVLDLSRNRIEELPSISPLVRAKKTVRKLDLSDNEIRELPPSFYKKGWKALHSVHLHGNQLGRFPVVFLDGGGNNAFPFTPATLWMEADVWKKALCGITQYHLNIFGKKIINTVQAARVLTELAGEVSKNDDLMQVYNHLDSIAYGPGEETIDLLSSDDDLFLSD